MDVNELVDGVLEARDRIAQPGAWTQMAGARDAKGERVHPSSPDATQWCILGTLQRSLLGCRDTALGWRQVRSICLLHHITIFNDGPDCTQEKAVERLDEVARWLKDNGLPEVEEVIVSRQGETE